MPFIFGISLRVDSTLIINFCLSFLFLASYCLSLSAKFSSFYLSLMKNCCSMVLLLRLKTLVSSLTSIYQSFFFLSHLFLSYSNANLLSFSLKYSWNIFWLLLTLSSLSLWPKHHYLWLVQMIGAASSSHPCFHSCLLIICFLHSSL